MRLDGRVCLITNCGDLQGAPDAAEFQREGAILALQTRDFAEAMPALDRNGVKLDGASSQAVRIIEADFAQPGVAATEIDRLVADTGRLDVLVNNNAPPHIEKEFHEITDGEWEEMYRRIVTEFFFTTRAAVRHMLNAGRGKILNIGSAGGIDPFREPFTAYCSARAAVLMLTKAVGRELAPHNVQMNAIAQNWVENPSYFPDEEISQPEFQEMLRTYVPARRLAKPWEQARLAAFLVSDDADFLCGTVIPFAGGDTL